MAAALAIRVVAGLAAAALAAVLLEHYGLAGQLSPLPQPRVSRSPHPAPGPGASNIFWGLQVTQREQGWGWVQSPHDGVRRGQFPPWWDRRGPKLPAGGSVLPWVGGWGSFLHLCHFLPP